MSRDYTLTKKVTQVVSLNYHNTLEKIKIVILFEIICVKSIAIRMGRYCKKFRHTFITAILYRDINNPAK